jgi:DNA-binding NarL/FixJ family response regulator
MSLQSNLPTLLVLTDHSPLFFWFKKHLSKQFSLLQAQTKQKTIELLQTTPLDLVIADPAIKETDVLELCRSLREAKPLLPILLITGKLKKYDQFEALKAGVTDFINDYLDLEELEMQIATVQKMVYLREKTAHLALPLPTHPKKSAAELLKHKIVLPDEALHFLSTAESQPTPAYLLLLHIDQREQLEKDQDYPFIAQMLVKTNELIHPLLHGSDLSLPTSEGDFLILTKFDPKLLAQNLIKHIQKHVFKNKKKSVSITTSIAIASLKTADKPFDQILQTAIQALNQSHTEPNKILFIDKDRLS